MTRRRAPEQHILVFAGRTGVDALPGEGQLRRWMQLQAGSADAPSPSSSTSTEVQLRWIPFPVRSSCWRCAATCATDCPTATSKNCSLSEAYPSTRHHLPLGAAVHSAVDRHARPCRHAAGDRWFVDETSKSPDAGSTCTGRPEIWISPPAFPRIALPAVLAEAIANVTGAETATVRTAMNDSLPDGDHPFHLAEAPPPRPRTPGLHRRGHGGSSGLITGCTPRASDGLGKALVGQR
jgi:hypothetical protein